MAAIDYAAPSPSRVRMRIGRIQRRMDDTRTSTRGRLARVAQRLHARMRTAMLIACVGAAGCAGRQADAAKAPTEGGAAGLAAALGSAVAEAMGTGSPGMVVAVGRGGHVVFARGYGRAAYYPDQRVSIVILQNSQSAERNEAAIERIVLDALRTEHRAGK
ncbi:hypothetical protein [Nannocystis pusilla]|uniref:hypothetical protein n=1 Tax=Nannocystis pusilla TaxID=889268 RepID=UPI003DA36583